MLHRIWQIHKKYPHEIYALERPHRNFIYASELLVIDEELAENKKRKREQNTK